ncbi:MAG: sugar phosphate isomerase/epimerase [Armatimonadetes bacterium]|nr:sugar phosphate isomerase/epimerase [Armatimonadota bacterium]
MSRIPIGLQLYTVREQLAEDACGTIKAVAAMGYEGVEGGAPAGMTNKAFLELLADNGLKLASGGVNPKELREALQAVVDRCGELGIDTVMTGIGGELHGAGGDWKRVVADLAEGCAKAAQAGLRVLYHNHAFEFEQKVDGVYGLDYLLDTIPATDIQTELDTYWVKTGGEDPVAYLNKYAGRLPRLHLKDRAPAPADETCPFAEVGQGILDWDGIFAAAPGAGVEWYLVEQDQWTRPPLESARMSADYLKSRGLL